MSGSDGGVSSSPTRTPTDSMSPARQQLLQAKLDLQSESATRATAAGIALVKAQIQSEFDERQAAFEEACQDQVRHGYLVKMEELRAQLMTINSNANAQPLPSSRPTYSGEEPSVAKTMTNIYDPKCVSNFARNN